MSNSARPPVPPHGGGTASQAPATAGPGAAAPAAPVTTCMLLIGDRVVLRANAPPDAEYLLFEIADIELRASEPGRVREHGYQTTVERARARLQQLGITAELARECAVAMHPVLSQAYARGPGVRHVARYLGPLELFQADNYDASTQTYHGVFIDLPALVADLRMPAASVAIQALFLATLLEAESDETTVFLSTDAWTKHRKPGERTHKRASLAMPRPLNDALSELAAQNPQPVIRDQLARADVIAFLRARADAAADEEGRELYASLERAIAVREMPDRGPLADPELWAIETRLDTGNLENILEAVEAVERSRGRTPGTTYLRARVSLTLHLEPPKLIAERVSALALSMTSFLELCLLAAEAWLDAGDPRRAMPYARDLVDAPGVDEGLLLRAKRILARAVGAAPEKHQTYADGIPAAPLPASQRPAAPSLPPLAPPDFNISQSWPPPQPRSADPAGPRRAMTSRGMGIPPPLPARARSQAPPIDTPMRPPPPSSPPLGALPPLPPAAPPPRKGPTTPEASGYESAAPARPAGISAPPPPRMPPPPTSPRAMPARSRPPEAAPISSMAPALRQRPERAEVSPSAPPPPIDLELPPPPDPSASFTLDLPSPDSLMPPTQDAPKQTPSSPPRGGPTASRRPVRRHSMGIVSVETRAPPAYDPRAEPDSSEMAASSPVSPHEDLHARPTPMRPPSPPTPPPAAIRAQMNTPMLDADLAAESREQAARALEREQDLRRRGGAAPVAAPTALHGASLPPFRLEDPPPLLPKAPLMPRLGGAADELAEHLPLPAGLGHEPRSLDALPKSVLEARVAFTLLARELGLDYRLKRGIELRADVSGIEAMQSVLLESFPDHVIRTAEDAYELRRHGALLSEILARRLEAEWIDISPNELGYWAMIVPPDTRVWPFARVARLVEMGHRERDLVSFFFEIQGRARGR
ncbi:MAG TPA: hypothetical protein VLT33_49970 [Labilithrix sp.]|nr:hypothetical protein [Labilithrix sp.]